MRLKTLAAILFAILTGHLAAEDFTLRDGRTITGATVLRSDVVAVTVSTSAGIERVPLAELPDEAQRRFNYDPQKAAAHLKQSASTAAAAAKQQADAKALAEKKKTAVQWQGSVQNAYAYGLIVIVTRGTDHNTTTQFLLVGHPKQRDLGVNSRLSFQAFRDGTQDVPDWDQRFERWVWVQDSAAKTVEVPPMYVAPKRLNRYERNGLSP